MSGYDGEVLEMDNLVTNFLCIIYYFILLKRDPFFYTMVFICK